MGDNWIKEYEFLRTEINQKIKLHNNLLTFTITTTVAILAIAASECRIFLNLLPFAIIIPMSMRIKYYRSAMAKLSSYMIVFIEKEVDGLNWETRNSLLINNTLNRGSKKDKNIMLLKYHECMLLSFACYIIFFFEYMNDIISEIATNSEINIKAVAFILLSPLLLVVWEFQITKQINLMDEMRQYWIVQWSKIKGEEQQ